MNNTTSAARTPTGRHRYPVMAVLAAAAAMLLILAAPVRAQGAAPPAAAASQPAAAPAPVPEDQAASTVNLTVAGLFRDTDALVRTVLILLLLASILTWTVWVAKNIELVRARRRLAADLRILSGADSMHALTALSSDAGRAIVAAVRAEVARAGDVRQPVCAEGLKERTTVRLLSVETALARRMSAGINIVASIGATAPFVGLFGTVWGIMSSFIGIARLQSSNLTAVAPGIAEALLTTAAGLAAAIPAVLIYNGFARSVSGYRALLADASNAAACVLSLDIERLQIADTQGAQTHAARAAPREELVGGA
ncbi:MAG: tonB-system energizer ExbB [Steroidobacteraceae bacterium]